MVNLLVVSERFGRKLGNCLHRCFFYTTIVPLAYRPTRLIACPYSCPWGSRSKPEKNTFPHSFPSSFLSYLSLSLYLSSIFVFPETPGYKKVFSGRYVSLSVSIVFHVCSEHCFLIFSLRQ